MQRQRPRFKTQPGAAPVSSPGSRIDHALDEARTLVLVAQVLLGFQFQAGFESGLQRLPALFSELQLGAIALMLLSVGLLALPASYHRLVFHGEERDEIQDVTSRSVGLALIPFALSLGLSVAIAVTAAAGTRTGSLMGGAVAFVAILFWYGYRSQKAPPLGLPASGRFAGIAVVPRESPQNPLDRKIDHVLTEIRLVLPGAQALLGFQLSMTFLHGFDALPDTAKDIYLVSLALIALATIFLMTPSAYHRIVEHGESTQRFHRFAGRMLLWAMAVLALALSADVYVAVSRVDRLARLAPFLALTSAAFFYTLWFAIPILRGRALRSRLKRTQRG